MNAACGKKFGARASLIALAFLALARLEPPAIHLCAFHWLTGRPCPLCGLTRAMFEMAKGHWRAALAYHALAPLAAVMLLAVLWEVPGRARLWNAGLAALAVYGVCRIVFPSLAC